MYKFPSLATIRENVQYSIVCSAASLNIKPPPRAHELRPVIVVEVCLAVQIWPIILSTMSVQLDL